MHQHTIPLHLNTESVEAREHALLSRIAQLEHMWREAEDRALCAEEAAMLAAAPAQQPAAAKNPKEK